MKTKYRIILSGHQEQMNLEYRYNQFPFKIVTQDDTVVIESDDRAGEDYHNRGINNKYQFRCRKNCGPEHFAFFSKNSNCARNVRSNSDIYALSLQINIK